MKKALLFIILSGIISLIVKAQNVGIGTVSPLARFHVADSSVLFVAAGEAPIFPGNPPVSGAGRRMMWYPDKGAFRTGYIDGSQWDKNNIGFYSFASGFNASANGGFSTALGGGTTATGPYTTAIGYTTTASGFGAAAIGFRTSAKAYGAISLGALNDDSDSPDPNNSALSDRIFQIGNGDINTLARNNALTVLRNGNTGLGTLLPGARLHIANGSSGYSNGYFPGTIIEGNSNTYLNFLTPNGSESGVLFGKAFDAASGGIVYNNPSNANGLQFRTNGNATRMVIDQSGNVGIGISTPGTKLHVVSGSSGYSGGYFPGAVIEGSGHTYLNILSPNNFESSILFGKASDPVSGGIMYNSSLNPNGFQFRTNGNIIRMSITSAGNVGIGNTNPFYTLDVSQRMRVRSGGNNTTSAGIWLNNNANTEAAFVGMEDDTHVGLFGNNGAGWKLTMNTQNGALKVNGSEGSAGQVLRSNGNASSPSWINPLNALYNNMTEYAQSSAVAMAPNTTYHVTGSSNVSLLLNAPSKVIISASVEIERSSCGGCGSGEIQFYIQMTPPLTNVAHSKVFLFPQEKQTLTIGPKFMTLGAGTYTINTYVLNFGMNTTASEGRLNIIVVPQ
ncbi:MAG TPA: hypothetical protein VIZ28_05595 [Chitinophagaceae bacterium]